MLAIGAVIDFSGWTMKFDVAEMIGIRGRLRTCVSITHVHFSRPASRRNMVCPTASRPMRVTAP
jgi:hypothetical protein